MKVKVNIINMGCILMSEEAFTMLSLTMTTSTVSEESLATDTHTHTHTDMHIHTRHDFGLIYVNLFLQPKTLTRRRRKCSQCCTLPQPFCHQLSERSPGSGLASLLPAAQSEDKRHSIQRLYCQKKKRKKKEEKETLLSIKHYSKWKFSFRHTCSD